MIPDGAHVKCLLRNNAMVEGIVEEWYGNFVKLISLDRTNIFIIHHPEEDIVLTKIILDDDIAEKEELDRKPPAEPSSGLEEQFQEVYESPSDDLRVKRLAELRIEMAKHDKEIVAKQLRNHVIGETKKVEYGTPGFIKKPSTK